MIHNLLYRLNYSDLSANRLTTLHKETFRGLTHLYELDLSHNEFDYIPFDVMNDLDGLVTMYADFLPNPFIHIKPQYVLVACSTTTSKTYTTKHSQGCAI